jgi:RNA polymerase sigma factor FliA
VRVVGGQQQSLAERDRLVMAHLDLVKAIARTLAQRLPAQIEVNELISVGVLGLIEAARRYDPTTGVPFSAFARPRLRGAMLDTLRGADWAPRSLRRLRRELDAGIARARAATGREPQEADIAVEMNMTIEQLSKALEQVRHLEIAAVQQLDHVDEDGGSLLQLCVDGDGPDVSLERAELRAYLAEAIAQLPQRERDILTMYYREEMTMVEIAQVFGLTQSRISQLRSLAISRLRASMHSMLGMKEAA